ncbi:MAG: MBL fold metallo-hydrolase [Turneriella sp.]
MAYTRGYASPGNQHSKTERAEAAIAPQDFAGPAPKDSVRVQFLGAAGFVTGSRTLLEYDGYRVYVDCGLYQGPKYVEQRNYLPLESEPDTIDAIVLTHAHIDHSGLIPRLVREGFKGKIFCTKPTAKLLEIILPDAGNIQEEEFRRLSKNEIKNLGVEAPLFTKDDGISALDFVHTVAYNRNFKVGPFTFRYTWAGHILGAAHLNVTRKNFSMVFSGDIGPESTFFHKPLKQPQSAKYIVTESTYGDRVRTEEDYEKKFSDAVRYVVERKGILLMPAFAVGRAQITLYVLYQLMQKKKIPQLRIALDSPMAVKATKTYSKFKNELTAEVTNSGFFEFLRSKNVMLIKNAEESRSLVEAQGPMIVVSASGMCTGGRVVHHLEHRLGDTRNAVTLYRLRRRRYACAPDSFRCKPREYFRQRSSGACYGGAVAVIFCARRPQRPHRLDAAVQGRGCRKIYINHGEDASRENLAKCLGFMKGAQIELPRYQSTYYLPCG